MFPWRNLSPYAVIPAPFVIPVQTGIQYGALNITNDLNVLNDTNAPNDLNETSDF